VCGDRLMRVAELKMAAGGAPALHIAEGIDVSWRWVADPAIADQAKEHSL
jgi:hypothetical protein